jgi:NAD(P)-dependent dehydrogenase (short-subunit alcohol dehydrogenase family)
MDLQISDKTALLMSSTRGLGFGCAEALVAEGVRVVINGRNTERGNDAVSRLGDKAHFVPADISQIVNVSSTSAKETLPGPLLANSMRPGLLGALGTLARKVAATDVTVNSILAGPFDTDLLRRFAPGAIGRADLSPEEAIQIYAGQRPMKRLGKIEEFGALCAFLCSRQAGYITGQSIVIDGGQVTTLL